MSVEQAIFTSARTGVCDGYHLVAAGEGISAAEARELAAWGPTHDSLRDTGADASSVNFHRLQSGNFCVSRTVAAGAEYSGRKGYRIYTQMLVIEPAEFARFANDPFQVMEAAQRQGQLTVFDTVPGRLEPMTLVPDGGIAEHAGLLDVAERYGARTLARLLEAVTSERPVAACGLPAPKQIVSALVKLMPRPARLDFSLTTGLRFSPRRPFRLIVLDDDRAQRRRLQRMGNITVFDWNKAGVETPGETNAIPTRLIQAHAPHRRFLGNRKTETESAQQPSGSLDLACEPLLDKLDDLDDAVFRAADGNTEALERVKTLWPKVLAELPPELADESREQYLRQIVTNWLDLRRSQIRDTRQAVAVLEMLALLFEGF